MATALDRVLREEPGVARQILAAAATFADRFAPFGPGS
ncbi:hypothetical protein SAMN06272765_7820 [Streptomyces sp. Ag109_G2-15]|nr:hypothetical protein SAMN06272765_7820 [Streptomyces sp. Ag109_G2-15]